jgi:hypothetical protein
MTRAPLIVAAWGGVLLLHAAVLLVWTASLLAPGLLAAAGGAAILWALAVSLSPPAGEDLALPDLSLAGVTLAVGLAVAAAGLVAGWWLVLVGGGIALAGGAGLLREWRAMRRDLRR